jgi:O-antigen ligase
MSRRAELTLVRGALADSPAPIRPESPRADEREPLLFRLLALALGLFCGFSFLFHGAYAYTVWAPVALVVITCALAALVRARAPLSRPALVAALALFALLAWSATSMLWAASVQSAWNEVDRLALYFAAFVLGLTILRARRGFGLLLAGFGAGALGFVVYVLVRLTTGHGGSLFLEFRLSDPLGYTNGQAGFLLMALWVFLPQAELARSRVRRAAAFGAAVAIADLLVLTQSRAIIPALAAAMALAIVVIPGRVRRAWIFVALAAVVAGSLPALLGVYAEHVHGRAYPSVSVTRAAGLAIIAASAGSAVLWWAASRLLGSLDRRISAGALAFVVVVGLALFAASVGDPRPELSDQWRQFANLEVRRDTTQRFTDAGGYRYDLWRVALAEFRAHPLRGVGIGNYASEYFERRATGESVRQPHSIELQALAELGVVGGALLLIVLVAVFAGAVGVCARASTAHEKALSLAGCGLVTAWLMDTSFDWLYNIPGLTLAAMLVAAALVSQPFRAERRQVAEAEPAGGNSRRLAAAAVAALVFAVMAAGIGRHYGAALYLDRASHELATNGAKAQRDARRALRLNPYDVQSYYVLAAGRARVNDYAGATNALRHAIRLEPWNYTPWALLGDIATRRGDARSAGRYYQRARQLNPRDPMLQPE